MSEVNYFKEVITQQTWYEWVIIIEPFNFTIRGILGNKNNDQPQQQNKNLFCTKIALSIF